MFKKVSSRVTVSLTFGHFRSELRPAGGGPVDSSNEYIRILTLKGKGNLVLCKLKNVSWEAKVKNFKKSLLAFRIDVPFFLLLDITRGRLFIGSDL